MSAAGERARALLGWYEMHRRDYPWRGNADPYRVLVSEVMLQQTQAGRVAARYPLFLERFPAVEVLAAATLPEVIEAWSGLGYYRRARRLLEAARIIAADGWPHTVEGLRQLPGVGPYTAAAVACFAFGVPVAAPDTNARRVLSRWHGRPLAGAALTAVAAEELVAEDAAAWNQALMDLGNGVCRPRRPDCRTCPVAEWCPGPEAYAPPPPQGRFEGSVRQARAAVLTALAGGPRHEPELATLTNLNARRLDGALGALAEEGWVVRQADGWVLAEA